MKKSFNQEWEKINQVQTDNWINSIQDRKVEWMVQDEDRMKNFSFFVAIILIFMTHPVIRVA